MLQEVAYRLCMVATLVLALLHCQKQQKFVKKIRTYIFHKHLWIGVLLWFLTILWIGATIYKEWPY